MVGVFYPRSWGQDWNLCIHLLKSFKPSWLRKYNWRCEPSDLSKDFADHFMALRNQSQTNFFLVEGKGFKPTFKNIFETWIRIFRNLNLAILLLGTYPAKNWSKCSPLKVTRRLTSVELLSSWKLNVSPSALLDLDQVTPTCIRLSCDTLWSAKNLMCCW